MTPFDFTNLIFFAAMALAMIVWGFTCTWARGKASGAAGEADKIARLENRAYMLRGQIQVLTNAQSQIKGARFEAQPITSPTPSKEHGMKTADLSPAMIGQTVRITRKGIAGTHNYIEGTLEDFSFDTTSFDASQLAPVRRHFIGLKAVVAGLNFNLTGSEELVVSVYG